MKSYRKDKHGIRIFKGAENINSRLMGDESDSTEKEPGFAELLKSCDIPLPCPDALTEKHQQAESLSKSTYPAQPQAEIDLHGFTAAEALIKTEAFIHTARGNGLREIRIITGKGLHSQGKAVLPDAVEGKLQELRQRKLVNSFKWEKSSKERSGSVIVSLGK
ncbi:MAG: Smr/MutS family protein [Proteobacteria bacterium]|nr:Smr/MutS family protein [Pseudomonadota bacterium]MBU1710307.1 Smr/MutS family protein [Pseudomonadota bacterium]